MWYTCSAIKKKITKHIKRKKKFGETKQVSEQDMGGMLGLSAWKFKTIMIKTSCKKKVGNATREGNPENQEKG
jgi:hypothetical protein